MMSLHAATGEAARLGGADDPEAVARRAYVGCSQDTPESGNSAAERP
jgi:hypothetical protein